MEKSSQLTEGNQFSSGGEFSRRTNSEVVLLCTQSGAEEIPKKGKLDSCKIYSLLCSAYVINMYLGILYPTSLLFDNRVLNIGTSTPFSGQSISFLQ